MVKHVASSDPQGHPAPQTKRAKTTASHPASRWNSRDWKKKKDLNNYVALMESKLNAKDLVVKKVIRISSRDGPKRIPFEIRVLKSLPDCNRLAKHIFYEPSSPDYDHGTAIFPHFPLGDVVDWRKNNFVNKREKPVPEAYIWRMFVQIAQAIAFIQNEIGPRRDTRTPLIHRDIKPRNILVAENGSTYPSFKLIDFGLATKYSLGKARRPSRCGTFEWQPPENPFINRKAADVWALGACVHYVALGKAPLGDVDQYTNERIGMDGLHPRSAQEYSTPRRYYAANVPREVTPIDLSERQQQRRGMVSDKDGELQYNHQYGTELSKWMRQCLRTTPSARPTVEKLVNNMVPEAYTRLKVFGGQTALIDMEVKFGP
ncbi:serine/threonine protein kinase-like protein [Byssothecium circinans]|uniref:Serine/threonine protein kinase-like protein n=1 Tax=Byssothecium circinans TaxID=147558 RepID=A0A6A5TXE3_9PLEO|nr:serine/threonine protein kinase-like protein [Byssothecium circinans]